MQVRHILQDKGRSVVTIAAGATLAEAATLLAQYRIGALLVRDTHGVLEGILSERDVVRALARDGAGALSAKVAQHMTPDPQTCTDAASIETIMEVMTRGRFRHVPVVDDKGALCGMISIGDVVKTRIAEAVQEADSLREYISASA